MEGVGDDEKERGPAGCGGAANGKDSIEQELKQEGELDDQSTSAAMAALQAQFTDEAFKKVEDFPMVQFQEQTVMYLNHGEAPACGGDEQHTNQEVSPSHGGLMEQEVARRSNIVGSFSELDENSARQLLTDSGWNVSQSVRRGGQTQWYYRSPPPKTMLLGSLTSAVAMWKSLVDEDHKRKGGGDDDPYPMVTAFLDNVRKPTGKKRKRARGRPKAN